ncbi:MAG: MOSC domain-containing protein [Deltaproteobacteria bacterium]|nr:MOSC domain-containing protein [Deltaproteobacteria bacterium]
MAHVEAVCTSWRTGVVKKEQAEVTLGAQWGVENDAHAGAWHRQVSLLAGESIDRVKALLPALSHGAFAENVITRGLGTAELKPGDQLQLGEQVLLEITQVGKECHNAGCPIRKATGDCIMPREGLFARVVRGGVTRAGDPIVVTVTTP